MNQELHSLAVFAVVIERGSFAAAARRLGRAQSAITYAVQKLEDQCGVPLFDRTSYRPHLTEEGRALLPRVRRIIDDLGEFRVQAKAMSKGIEAELVLVVETFLPLSIIAPALRRFQAEFPMVQLRIVSIRPQDAFGQLQDHDADMGLFLLSPNPEPEIESHLIAEMDFVAVATPDHPLAHLPAGFPKEAMIIDAEISVQQPDQVDIDALKAVFPYGHPNITVTKGGLDIAKPHSDGHTVIANAALIVSFDMEPAQ